MTVFIYLLASLLLLNVLLLAFSVNGAKSPFKKPVRKTRENQVPSFLEQKLSQQAEYKKAV